jgi:hypothetical protein
MRLDDPVISRNGTRIEDPAYDALFAAGFYLFGWDVEWAHRHGIPRQSVRTMVDLLTGSHSRKPGKVVMLMHDVMMRAPKAGRTRSHHRRRTGPRGSFQTVERILSRCGIRSAFRGTATRCHWRQWTK